MRNKMKTLDKGTIVSKDLVELKYTGAGVGVNPFGYAETNDGANRYVLADITLVDGVAGGWRDFSIGKAFKGRVTDRRFVTEIELVPDMPTP